LVHVGMSRNIKELLHHFSTEEACAEALTAVKWPKGFVCAQCGHREAYRITTRKLPLFECTACRYQASLRTGTIMEGSGTTLRKWFHSVILFSLIPSGINAVQLQAAINVTYKTAWLMLHKLRYAMGQADAGDMLSGIVRINAAKYGKPYNPSVLRHIQEQPLLIGASMTVDGEPIHIKIKQIADKHLRENTILSSGTKAFIELEVAPNAEDLQCITTRFGPRRCHRLLDIVKQANTWIHTKYLGIGPKHLQTYLDEFSFRKNIILQKVDALVFNRFICLCASISPLTYSALTRNQFHSY
jgi:transposase-like protein